MMLATGTLHLGSKAPMPIRALDGTFSLMLFANDRIAAMQAEPWCITWFGMAAESFWLANKGDLRTGQAIDVQLERMRSFTTGGRFGGAETHAQAVSIRLAINKHDEHQRILRQAVAA